MSRRRASSSRSRFREVALFGGLFLGCTVLFHLLFNRYQDVVGLVYVRSMTHSASFLLHLAGIPSIVTTDLRMGACALEMTAASYLVTQGCTGLFTSSLYAAGVIAYPVGATEKGVGLLIGVPAFFVFGTMRVMIMGIVAEVQPASVQVFHLYIMAVANLGFAIFVWMYWLHRVAEGEERSLVSG